MLAFVPSRRGAIVVVVAWIAAAAVGYFGHAQLPALTAGNPASFLPRHSQSTQAVQQMGKGFPGGVDVPAMVVFARSDDGLLTPADRAAIGAYGDQVDALGLRGATPALDPLLTSGQEDVLGTAGLISR